MSQPRAVGWGGRYLGVVGRLHNRLQLCGVQCTVVVCDDLGHRVADRCAWCAVLHDVPGAEGDRRGGRGRDDLVELRPRRLRHDALVLGDRRAVAKAHPGGACRAGRLRLDRASEKDTLKLAQKLGQLQHFIAVFQQECMGQRALFGPT